MIKISCLIALFTLSRAIVFAQKDTTSFYMNGRNMVELNKDSAKFIRIVISIDTAKKRLFSINDFYLNGKPKLITRATNVMATCSYFFRGTTNEFYQNGSIKTVVNYVDGKATGDKSEYYPNGQLYAITNEDNPN